jgi:hypothetical protein
MVQRSKINQARRHLSKDKGNPSKPKTGLIKIISEKKVVCYELGLDVDKDVYESIVEAGRIHIASDKDALFQYALKTALNEMVQ